MKIILFTTKNAWAAEILAELHKYNIPVEAIFVENPGFKSNYKKLIRYIKRYGFLESIKLVLKILVRSKLTRDTDEFLNNSYYASFSNQVYIVDSFNGTRCQNILIGINPDIILLGGSRILRNNIIDIPRVGIRAKK